MLLLQKDAYIWSSAAVHILWSKNLVKEMVLHILIIYLACWDLQAVLQRKVPWTARFHDETSTGQRLGALSPWWQCQPIQWWILTHYAWAINAWNLTRGLWTPVIPWKPREHYPSPEIPRLLLRKSIQSRKRLEISVLDATEHLVFLLWHAYRRGWPGYHAQTLWSLHT